MDGPETTKTAWDHSKDVLKWGASAIIVFSYIGIVVWLLFRLGAGELVETTIQNIGTDGEPTRKATDKAFGENAWDQITHLLTALAALVTTAVGVLIGVQLQQGSVNSANKRAARSEAEAEKAKVKKDAAQTAAAKALETAEAATVTKGDVLSAPQVQVLESIKADLRAAIKP